VEGVGDVVGVVGGDGGAVEGAWPGAVFDGGAKV